MDDEESQSQSNYGGKSSQLAGYCCCVLCFLLILYPLVSLRIVPAASVGVVSTLGAVQEGSLPSGIHVVNPFASVAVFSARTMLLEEHSNVPTEVGLNVQLDVGMLYHIDPEKAHMIYTGLGEAYEDTFLKPQLASILRGVTGAVQPEALYTSTRSELQDKLTSLMATELKPRGIIVENVLFKDLTLPQTLKTSIETKTAAQQEAERLTFVIQRETQEAERKKIEAGGIKDFQNIVSEGISDQLLQWKGIEATERMINAKNAKIIMMGNSKVSLPMLNSEV